jgi:cytochrome c
MRIICRFLLAAGLLTTAAAVLAEDGAALVQARKCYACHHLTATLLGPSYQAIAGLHGPRREVMGEVLAHKIIAGGAGNWGVVPMVPNPQVSAEEARVIADWILQLPH